MKKIQLLLSAMFIICSLNAQVIINEISYNPCTTQGADGDCEYIEIYNSGATAVDLSDWTIDDPVFTFPAGTMIAADAYILITDDGNFASCIWANPVPAGVQTFAWGTGNLGNSGESISLSDAGATVQDMFTYDDGPCGADGDCNSLQYSGTGDNMDCTTWVAQLPTPGASNEVAPTDCPDGSNFGDPCDDGVATTINDTVQDDCTCVGTDAGLTDCGAFTWEAVQVVNNSMTDVWTAIIGGWSMNGFVGGGVTEQVDQWLVYGPIDVTAVSSLFLNFDATESFGVTDLNVVWTDTYTGCPADATWTNAATLTDAGAASVDLSAAVGTAVFIAIEYSDDGADGYSGWDLTNFALLADVCPTPGIPMISMCTEVFDCPTEMANIGDACDDMDAATADDIIQADCSCAGTAFDCPTEMANIGDACDDLNAATTNDIVQADCSCAGTVPMAADVYISELSFNPCGDQGVDTDCEYLIITNAGATDADISGYMISNGFTYTFPAGTIITAGGTLSLGVSADCTGLDAFDLSGGWSGGMSNSTDETIEILDATGALISAVTYDGAIGDGDCNANCFDAVGTVSDCPSSLYNPVLDCPDLAANIGDACDDMDAATVNDVVQADCTCAGVAFDCPTEMANIGDACDDMDGATADDVIQADCSCAGTAFDCPTEMANIGDACDDLDAATVNDVVQADCSCAGTPVGPAADVYISELSFNPCGDQGVDTDCEYLIITNAGATDADISGYMISNGFTYTFPAGTIITAGGTLSLGVSADCTGLDAFDLSGGWSGGMSNSTDETIEILDATGALISAVTYDGAIGDGDCNANCFDAVGTVSDCPSSLYNPVLDCPDLAANIGDACDDMDAATANDVVQADCTCAGVAFDCPTEMANIGDACDDMDAATADDVIQADCSCAGTAFDCPTEMANIGDACDDLDAATVNDVVQADCSCAGTPVGPAADVYISELSFNPCGDQGVDTDCEYLIITNAGATDADISGYMISNGFTYTFPAGTIITAGGTLSLGVSANCAGLDAFDLSGGWSGGMSNSTDETIEILDATGALISAVTYDGAIGDGDCNANCFDAVGTVSDCPSSLYNPVFDCPDLAANIGDACDDMDAATANDVVQADCTCAGTPVVLEGCTDPLATNYDDTATADNGTCLYLCDDTAALEVTTNGGFDGGTGLSYGLPGGMGLLAGANNDFGGFVWNTNTTGLGSDEICIFIDFEVTGDAAGFPVTLEFRIENNDCGFFPCPWNDFNAVITAPGTYTYGGVVSTGNVGGNGAFDPAGANPAIVAAITNFSGTPLGADVNVSFSNLCISTDCPAVDVLGCTDVNACNYNPDATVDDSSCYNVGDACDADGDSATMDVWLDCATCGTMGSTPGCTDANATNYDSTADTDDGSCLYLCDDASDDLLDVSTSGGFDGGSGLSYGSPTGMGLFAGANNDFAGFIWNVNTTGLTNDDFCIAIDYEVTGDAAAFPITLEFRIENGECGGFPCPWIDFNVEVTGPGTYTLGGVVSSGNPSTAGAFDPAGANTAIVAAIANFSGTPLGADINVNFSNLCVSTDCGTVEPPADCAPSIIQFPANPSGN